MSCVTDKYTVLACGSKSKRRKARPQSRRLLQSKHAGSDLLTAATASQVKQLQTILSRAMKLKTLEEVFDHLTTCGVTELDSVSIEGKVGACALRGVY